VSSSHLIVMTRVAAAVEPAWRWDWAYTEMEGTGELFHPRDR
jgi:hypothetical protein